MSPFGLAWRSLTRQPARSALGVAGVAIVGALLLDMLLLAQGLQVSFRDLLDSVGFEVRVMATDSMPGTGPLIEDGARAARAIVELAEVEEVASVRLGQGRISTELAQEQPLELVGIDGRMRGTWIVLSGDDRLDSTADGPPPIVINRQTAEQFALTAGDSVLIRGACLDDSEALPREDFRVAGVVDFRFDAPQALRAAIRLDALGRVCALADPQAVDFLLVGASASPLAALGAIDRARPDLHAFSNRQLVERMGVSNFSYFRQISRALTAITLFFAFLLIATLLTVSVNQRLGEVAGLRALGFGRARVVADLACESLLLVGIGGALSLPAGGVLALGLDSILTQIPGLPERLHFFVFQPAALALHFALLTLTGLLAVAYPVWLVARLPIAATLRKEIVS